MKHSRTLHILSLGAGVQSTTLALMAAHGEIEPMPDAAIFADTGWEPRAVYEHLRWLMSPNVLPFPVHIISAGNLRHDIENLVKLGKGSRRTPPLFTPGKDGKGVPLRRQCTSGYKIEPITKLLRRLIGVKPRQRMPAETKVNLWLGISLDEIYRMKPAREPWIERRWPLVDLRMSRWDCLRWVERNGYPKPPRSSCIGCPYHSDEEWRRLRDNTPEEWKDAVAVDVMIRGGFMTTHGPLYLHRSLRPLDEVDLSTPADHGQGDLFGNECEGMCGL